MKYKILSGGDKETLEIFVNNLMKEGFKPQGGVCLDSYDNGNDSFVQAMVKEDN